MASTSSLRCIFPSSSLSCISAILALLCLRSASARSLSASAFAVSAVLASLPLAFSRRCFMYALIVGSRSNLYGRVDAAGITPDFASCCTRRSSSSKSFAIVAVVCRFCFGASAMTSPPFRCSNETKRPEKNFLKLREFWARKHRRALATVTVPSRLVEKFRAFASRFVGCFCFGFYRVFFAFFWLLLLSLC